MFYACPGSSWLLKKHKRKEAQQLFEEEKADETC